MNTPNARFWEYVNGGLVKITLRTDQSLSWETRYPTDEGWYAEHYTWTHNGDRVTCEGWHDGCDCDGRLSGECESECLLTDLRAGNEPYGFDEAEIVGIRYPAWKRVRAGQRDYAAEAAGY